jgi:hypothetical protein
VVDAKAKGHTLGLSLPHNTTEVGLCFRGVAVLKITFLIIFLLKGIFGGFGCIGMGSGCVFWSIVVKRSETRGDSLAG